MDQDARIPSSTSMDAWLEKLAEPTGAPGGGAASGLLLGITAALLHMVAAYTPDDPRARASGERLVGARRDALAAAEADGIRSSDLGAALAEPDEPDRGPRVRDAAIVGAESSAVIGEIGIALVGELRILAESGNPHLAADLSVAAEALSAGLGGALATLRANVALAQSHREDARHDFDRSVAALQSVEARMLAARDAAAAVATVATG